LDEIEREGSVRLLLIAGLLFAGSAPAQSQAELDEALLTAARKGNLAQVKELLAKGANLEAKTRHGLTPLYYAATHGNIDVLNFLIEKGADINVRDTFYKAGVLDFAIQNGHTDAALILVQKGNKDAEGALPDAAAKGDAALVKAILARGEIKPATLTRALSRAEDEKQTQVAELLKQAGAQPAKRPDFAVDAAVLATYAGRYRDERLGEWVFTLKEGKLYLDPGGQQFELGAFDAVTFGALKLPGAKLKFVLEAGKATAVEFTGQGGQTMTLKRVEAK
jgi:hypothetical protein